MTETLEFSYKIRMVETVKAQARVRSRQFGAAGVQDFAPPQNTGKTRDKVAAALHTNHETLRQAQYIYDNQDMISLETFEQWDERKLSTNKVFRQIKEAKEQAERAQAQTARELDIAELYRKTAEQTRDDALRENKSLKSENAKLKRKVAEIPEPEVVEREVVPEDYEEAIRRAESLRHENQRLLSENQDLRESNLEKDREIEQKDELLGERERNSGANRDVEQLVNNIYTFLNRHGGKSRAFDQFYRVDETTQQECRKALTALVGFSQSLLAMTSDAKELGGS